MPEFVIKGPGRKKQVISPKALVEEYVVEGDTLREKNNWEKKVVKKKSAKKASVESAAKKRPKSPPRSTRKKVEQVTTSGSVNLEMVPDDKKDEISHGTEQKKSFENITADIIDKPVDLDNITLADIIGKQPDTQSYEDITKKIHEAEESGEITDITPTEDYPGFTIDEDVESEPIVSVPQTEDEPSSLFFDKWKIKDKKETAQIEASARKNWDRTDVENLKTIDNSKKKRNFREKIAAFFESFIPKLDDIDEIIEQQEIEKQAREYQENLKRTYEEDIYNQQTTREWVENSKAEEINKNTNSWREKILKKPWPEERNYAPTITPIVNYSSDSWFHLNNYEREQRLAELNLTAPEDSEYTLDSDGFPQLQMKDLIGNEGELLTMEKKAEKLDNTLYESLKKKGRTPRGNIKGFSSGNYPNNN